MIVPATVMRRGLAELVGHFVDNPVAASAIERIGEALIERAQGGAASQWGGMWGVSDSGYVMSVSARGAWTLSYYDSAGMSRVLRVQS